MVFTPLMTHVRDLAHPAADRAAFGPASAGRWMAASAMVACSAAVLAWDGLRSLEASASSFVLRLVGAGGMARDSVVLVVDATRDDVAGVPSGGFVAGSFEIVSSCSVAMFLAPLWLAAGVLLLVRRTPPMTVLRLALGFTFLLVAVSQARYVVTGWLIHSLGQERGYPLAHVLIGSILSTVGLVGGTVAFLVLALRTKDTSPPHRTPSQGEP
jgi:hypothetical protein